MAVHFCIEVPLNKAAYKDPPNPFVQCFKNCAKNTKKCVIKTLLLPILLLAWAFQDRESARLVAEEEDNAKEKAAYEEKMEMQLATRTKGGFVDDGGREDLGGLEGLGVPGSQRWLRVTASTVTDVSSSESDCGDLDDEEMRLGLSLAERLQGGKAKQAAMKAAREAEANYAVDDNSDEEVVKKKKKGMARARRSPKSPRPLRTRPRILAALVPTVYCAALAPPYCLAACCSAQLQWDSMGLVSPYHPLSCFPVCFLVLSLWSLTLDLSSFRSIVIWACQRIIINLVVVRITLCHNHPLCGVLCVLLLGSLMIAGPNCKSRRYRIHNDRSPSCANCFVSFCTIVYLRLTDCRDCVLRYPSCQEEEEYPGRAQQL